MESPPPAAAGPESPAAAPPAALESAPSPQPAPVSSGRPPPDKVRTNVKMAGVAMLLIGVIAAWQAYGAYAQVTHVYSDDEVKGFADLPGGNLTVEVVGANSASPANVTISDFNHTQLASALTGPDGRVTLASSKVVVRVVVVWHNATWTRNAILPPGFGTALRFDTAESTAAPSGWMQPDAAPVMPIIAGVGIVGVVLAVTGVFAFRLRARKIALTGAALFVAAAVGYLALAYAAGGANLGALLLPLMIVAMAGFCVWAIRNGRDRFQPVRLGSIQL